MFDLGWSEMAVIMLVALVVIGPKDLPRMARTVGQWVAKGRAMAREFQRSLEEMAREAELDDVKKEIEKVGRTNIGKTIEKTIDPGGELSKAFEPGSAGKSSAKAKDGASLANGEAKSATAEPDAKAEQDVAAESATKTPKAAGRAKTAAASKAAAKPKATSTRAAAKSKTAAKPRTSTAKTVAKPRATAKRKTRQSKTSTTAPQLASSETAEAETVAEPH